MGKCLGKKNYVARKRLSNRSKKLSYNTIKEDNMKRKKKKGCK